VGKELWLNNEKTRQNVGWLNRLLYSLKLPLNRFSDDHGIEKYIQALKVAAHNNKI